MSNVKCSIIILNIIFIQKEATIEMDLNGATSKNAVLVTKNSEEHCWKSGKTSVKRLHI